MPIATPRTVEVAADFKTDTSRNQGKYRMCKSKMGNGSCFFSKVQSRRKVGVCELDGASSPWKGGEEPSGGGFLSAFWVAGGRGESSSPPAAFCI